jgi:hypothetical protein
MPRPPIEVADVIRAVGESFFEGSQKWFSWLHLKVLNAILCCRTAALGGHVDKCSACGHQAISFNSCRNRHCPKCQANARDRWLEARGKELLSTRYVHVVFTLPRQLSPLALVNKREIYALLFREETDLGAEALAASCTPGTRNSSFIRTSTVWFQPAGWLPTTRSGSTRSRNSSCLWTF